MEEIDRRVARTRRTLHEALIRLIMRKGYDTLTVQEIIDEADIGRATFYAHYRSKDALLRGGFERLRSELKAARQDVRHGGERDPPLTFSFAMFEHACAYRDVYRAMLGGQGSIIAVNEIRRVLSELVKEELPTLGDDDVVPRELMLQFVVGTFLTTLTWCLEKRPKLAPSEANAIFRHLVMQGIGWAIVSDGRQR
ncbi:TetR/AcrR family transcriptional regulator [Bradyrhizobium murdochi]|uniref:TetR/AcrR family transcriptional regulator n=1 Tax=Bradyrhizobium murdochi TaxID=1038859 RepID=UPI00041A8420|nr:TetR/AcrR family transcriptional regulator [Bradyrhizobium murdochi]